MRVLLVEDDPQLASIIESGLREHSFEVIREATAPAGRSRALLGAFDVIILDVMLPGGDGFSLCKALRDRGIGTPVLMLTARDAVDDRVKGLDAGADDYLTKPFAFRELVPRQHPHPTRRPTPLPEIVTIEDLEVDLRAHRVKRAGRPIELTAKEFALLELLVRHRNQVVDRTAITAHVWDENHDPFTNVLEVLVRRLRRKIDDGFAVKMIHTLRGAGYRLGA
jgi:two-component system copper resistance phosphate regulon response regulator CusR